MPTKFGDAIPEFMAKSTPRPIFKSRNIFKAARPGDHFLSERPEK
jgi:hypothetical protein